MIGEGQEFIVKCAAVCCSDLYPFSGYHGILHLMVVVQCLQGLLYARSLLKKLVDGSDAPSNSERRKDADDGSYEAGSSSAGNQIADELSELLSQADVWFRRAELLQSLLGSGISVSLDDIADQESSACLRDRLISEERYSMAVYTCKKCKVFSSFT